MTHDTRRARCGSCSQHERIDQLKQRLREAHAREVDYLTAVYEQKKAEAQEANERLTAAMRRAVEDRTRIPAPTSSDGDDEN